MNSKFDKRINDIYETLIEIAPPADADKAEADLAKTGRQLAADYEKQGIVKKVVKSVTDRKAQETKEKAARHIKDYDALVNRGVNPALKRRNDRLRAVVDSLEDNPTE